MKYRARWGCKDTRELVQLARELGCSVGRTGRNHVLVRSPCGEMLTLSGTAKNPMTDVRKLRSWARGLQSTRDFAKIGFRR